MSKFLGGRLTAVLLFRQPTATGPGPTFSSFSAAQNSDTSVSFQWSTDITSTPNSIIWGTTSGSYPNTQSASNGTTHTTSIGIATPTTPYTIYYKVRGTANGTQTTSSEQTIAVSLGLFNGGLLSGAVYRIASAQSDHSNPGAVASSSGSPYDTKDLTLNGGSLSNSTALYARASTATMRNPSSVNSDNGGAVIAGPNVFAARTLILQNAAGTTNPSGVFNSSFSADGGLGDNAVIVYFNKTTNLPKVNFNSSASRQFFEINFNNTEGWERTQDTDWDNSAAPTTLALTSGPNFSVSPDYFMYDWIGNIPNNYSITVYDESMVEVTTDRSLVMSNSQSNSIGGLTQGTNYNYDLTIYGQGGTSLNYSGPFTTESIPDLAFNSLDVLGGAGTIEIDATANDTCDWTINLYDGNFEGSFGQLNASTTSHFNDVFVGLAAGDYIVEVIGYNGATNLNTAYATQGVTVS